MKPIEFAQQTAIIAKDQPEYQPLPVFQDGTYVISKWKISWWERWRILWGAPLWVMQMNFGQALQPQYFTLDQPFEDEKK